MLFALLAGSLQAGAYPLDGYERTGIARLLHQRWVQEGAIPGKKRPSGELLPMERVDLRLADRPDLILPQPDPQLGVALQDLLGAQASRYGIALLDLSDPAAPRYAEWNGGVRQNPGSVGKLLVGLAIFQALADAWPDDIPARERVLREAMITADVFSVYDHHAVRFFDPEARELVRRPLHEGDTASLWTYLDWMMSPSSNAAAGMLQKHLMLLKHFGAEYPVSPDRERLFFEDTPAKQLAELFASAIQEPVARNGLDLDALRQGSFFTHQGKQRVLGTTSYATPRSLVELMLKMEQGVLVDAWSSRELKRLMYITERRIRYGSSGALRKSAVYFKSGSLYSCEPEPGFECKKYHGNKRNFMNSAAIIETPAGQNRLHYVVAVLSNVLRVNSAQDHRDLAQAIHGVLLNAHPQRPVVEGELPPSARYGEGFIGYESERAGVALKLKIQEALLALGYDIGEIDGVIGAKTRTAIRTFQRSNGLPANGEVSQPLVDQMRRIAQEHGLARPDPPPAVATGE